MRLFLLPISTRQSLIYCQRINQQLSDKTTYIDRVTAKASTTWLSWEKKDSGWQRKVTDYGNKLFQRLPYEEWGLKSIPPLSTRRRSDEIDGEEEVYLEYPELLIEPERVLDALKVYGSNEKQAFHSKWLWGSIIGMPISAPVALLPVIPNLPFFYLCFRAWSHWRARGGSQHLEFLLDNKLIKMSPSAALRMAYTESMMDKTLRDLDVELESISSKSNTEPKIALQETEEELLMSRNSGALIADCLQLPELAEEIQRAVWQVERSLNARKELQKEKVKLDSANKTPLNR